MIGQVISQTLGLSLSTSAGKHTAPHIESVNSEEQGQSHNQSFLPSKSEVEISDTALELSLHLTEDEPNWKRVQAMASQLSSNMDSNFLKAGIDTSQPIRINIHPFTGIPFVGDHPDKSRIQNLLDNTPSLIEQIKNVNHVASYSYQASQAANGISSSATPMNDAYLRTSKANPNTRLQSALEQYEQSSQVTRISMQYQQGIGITLDVLSPKNKR